MYFILQMRKLPGHTVGWWNIFNEHPAVLMTDMCILHISTIIIFVSYKSSIPINLVHSSLLQTPMSQHFYYISPWLATIWELTYTSQ